MAEIIPAIIPKTFKDLEEKLALIKGETNFVHIDIVDGTVGGKPSWPLVGDTGEFQKIKNQERGMPFWEEFDFEFHLMTSDPLSHARDYIDAGASRIVLHAGSLNYENDIQFLDQLKTTAIVELGIAVDINTPLEDVKIYFQVADFIQIMTIPQIGEQGAPFDPQGLENLRWIKENFPQMIVSVDGAMRPETAEAALNTGADRIIAGSFIFDATNPREAIEELKSLV